MGVQTPPKPQPSPGRNRASGLEILSWGLGCRAGCQGGREAAPSHLAPWCAPRSRWDPSGCTLLAPLVSILSLIPGGWSGAGGGWWWCSQTRRGRAGEGAGDNASWFPSGTFTHYQLPCCPTSWPLGRRNRDTFWLPVGLVLRQSPSAWLREGALRKPGSWSPPPPGLAGPALPPE